MEPFQFIRDPYRMKEVLQSRLPDFSNGNLLISSCEIEHLLFKKSFKEGFQRKASLGVGYILEVFEPSTQKQGQLKLYGKAYLDGRSQKIFDSLPARVLTPPLFGEPLVHLPEWDLILWAFPNDPQLWHLPSLVDRQHVQDLLPFQQDSGIDTFSSHTLSVLGVHVVRYKPELRCTLRYDLLVHTPSSSRPITIYAKAFPDGQCEGIYERTQFFAEQALKHPDGFFVPKPLGLNSAINTIWQPSVPGRSLLEVLNPTTFHNLMTLVGKGLARFHMSPLSMPRKMSVPNQLQEARKRLGKIYRHCPERQDSLETCLATLEERAACFPSIRETVIHGDFHAEQLLVSEDRIALFDFDDLAFGDPLQDVADFMAQLHFYDYTPDCIQDMSMAFCRAYANHVSWEVSPERLDWHMRIHFMRKACREFLQPPSPDLQRMEYFLTLACEGSLREIHCSTTFSLATGI
ncbi:MAG: aminoglycoside phosphotransferase family protein [Nitrospirota bacterium]|nr:aminoglycoside phosphotransferase family protein [Nitrospirota bacterium]